MVLVKVLAVVFVFTVGGALAQSSLDYDPNVPLDDLREFPTVEPSFSQDGDPVNSSTIGAGMVLQELSAGEFSDLNVFGKTTLDLNLGNVEEEALMVKSGGNQLKLMDVDSDHLVLGHNGANGYLMDKTGAGTTGASLYLNHNGNIGINTGSPAQKLDVNGHAAIRGSLLTGSTQVELNYYGTGDRYSYIDFHSDDTNTDFSARVIRGKTVDGNFIFQNKGAGNFSFLNNSSEVFKIASNGNVGIGTTSPDGKIDIAAPTIDTVGANSALRLSSSGGTNLFNFRLENANRDFTIDSAGYGSGWNRSMTINRQSNATSFYGKVGIGTTTPSEKLEVNGNFKLNGNLISDSPICIGKCQ